MIKKWAETKKKCLRGEFNFFGCARVRVVISFFEPDFSSHGCKPIISSSTLPKGCHHWWQAYQCSWTTACDPHLRCALVRSHVL